jgi:hypothetical protein
MIRNGGTMTVTGCMMGTSRHHHPFLKNRGRLTPSQDAMIVTTDGTVEPNPAGAKDGLTGQLQPPPYQPSEEQEITGDAGVSAKQLGVRKADKVEFGFWLSFDELHAEMQRRFEEDGAAARVWIGGVIDTSSTGNVLSKWVGRDDDGDSNLDNEA